MSTTDEVLEANRAHAAEHDGGGRAAPPSRRVAVVACMDARLDVYRALGLELGEAHVIRNAGGVVTDDVVRSLVISQRKLGTDEVVLVHHSDCGMTSFDGTTFADELEAETGMRPAYDFDAFADIDTDVREGLARVTQDPHLRSSVVRGFVYELQSGELREVHAQA